MYSISTINVTNQIILYLLQLVLNNAVHAAVCHCMLVIINDNGYQVMSLAWVNKSLGLKSMPLSDNDGDDDDHDGDDDSNK